MTFNINVSALKNFFTSLHPKSKHLLKLAQISNARPMSIDIVQNQTLTGVLQKSCSTHGKTPEMESIFSKAESLCMQLYRKIIFPKWFASEFWRNLKIAFTCNTYRQLLPLQCFPAGSTQVHIHNHVKHLRWNFLWKKRLNGINYFSQKAPS